MGLKIQKHKSMGLEYDWDLYPGVTVSFDVKLFGVYFTFSPPSRPVIKINGFSEKNHYGLKKKNVERKWED